MRDVNERDARLLRRIASARVKHMSNAKWRKLFASMHTTQTAIRGIAIKVVNDDRHFVVPTPGPDFDHDDNFGECGGISYVPFRHIEFVQIPKEYEVELDGSRYSATRFTNDLDTLIQHLAEIGEFPIQTCNGGIRVLGYEWDNA